MVVVEMVFVVVIVVVVVVMRVGWGGVPPVFLHPLVLSSFTAERKSKGSCVGSGDRSGVV